MKHMRTTLGVTVAAVVAACWLLGQDTVGKSRSDDSAEPAGAACNTSIAVIDVKRTFEESASFQQELGELKAEVRKFNERIAVRQVEIENLQKKLKQLKPGTGEFETTQLLLTRVQTELQLESTRRKQQFLKQEAILYKDTYAQVTAAIARYAEANGVRLVLRSNENAMDPENQQSVLSAVNQMVVYQQGLDITDAILAALNAEEDTDT
jgi:Skp family chaperone for outer membrane proteins